MQPGTTANVSLCKEPDFLLYKSKQTLIDSLTSKLQSLQRPFTQGTLKPQHPALKHVHPTTLWLHSPLRLHHHSAHRSTGLRLRARRPAKCTRIGAIGLFWE